jgi:hypothetical protein
LPILSISEVQGVEPLPIAIIDVKQAGFAVRWNPSGYGGYPIGSTIRLLKNTHLLRCAHLSSLRRTV